MESLEVLQRKALRIVLKKAGLQEMKFFIILDSYQYLSYAKSTAAYKSLKLSQI